MGSDVIGFFAEAMLRTLAMGFAMVFLFLVLATWYIHSHAKDLCYVQIREDNGQVTGKAYKVTSGLLHTKGPGGRPETYFIKVPGQDVPDSHIFWPVGLPGFLQIPVPMRLFERDNPDPIRLNRKLRTTAAIVNAAINEEFLSVNKDIKAAIDSHMDHNKWTSKDWIFAGLAAVAAVAAGGAVYFVYTLSQDVTALSEGQNGISQALQGITNFLSGSNGAGGTP